jgi:hypothetical protein
VKPRNPRQKTTFQKVQDGNMHTPTISREEFEKSANQE